MSACWSFSIANMPLAITSIQSFLMKEICNVEEICKCHFSNAPVLGPARSYWPSEKFKKSVQSHLGNIRLLPSLQRPRSGGVIAHTIRDGCLGEAPCSSHSPKSIHFPLPSMPAPGSFQLSLACAAPGWEGAAHLIPAILECKIEHPCVLELLPLPLKCLTGTWKMWFLYKGWSHQEQIINNLMFSVLNFLSVKGDSGDLACFHILERWLVKTYTAAWFEGEFGKSEWVLAWLSWLWRQ